MKQFRSTAILFIVAIIFGGYLYFRERGPAAGVGNTVLLRTDPDTVKQVSIIQPNFQLSLVKAGDTWMVTNKTETVPADPDSVNALLDNLQLVQSGSVVTQPEKLREYGLDDSHNYIAVNATAIYFGDSPGFDKNQVYVQVKIGNNTTIALLPTTLRDDALKTFANWRDKAALRFEDQKVNQLQISAPNINATFVAEKNKDSTDWKITKPINAKADSGAVQSFLTSLSSAQASSFLDDNPKDLQKWGLEKPQATVQISTPNGVKELKIGKAVTGGVAAQNSLSKTVFVLPTSIYSLINRAMSKWRDKNLLTLDTGKVTQMQITARGKTVTLNLSGTQWTASNPKLDKTLVGNAASDFLVGIQNLQADNFIDSPKADTAYGFDHPALKVQLTSSQWKGVKTLEMASQNGKNYARLSGTGVTSNMVYVMPTHVFDAFSDALDHLFGK
jgi:hypothetical protein